MGFAEALQAGSEVGQRIGNNLDPIRRQSALEQLQAQRQANALADINLQKQQMTYQDMLGARDMAAKAQGTPAQSTTTVQPAPAQSPSIQDAFGISNNTIGANPALAGTPQTQQQADISGLQSQVQQYPALAKLNGSDTRLGAMQQAQAGTPPTVAPDTPVDASGFPAVQADSDKNPLVKAYADGRVSTTTTPAVPPDRIKAQIDYYDSVGNPEAVAALQKQAMAHAHDIVDATGNPNEGVNIINKALGTNYSYLKLPDVEFMKDGEGNIISAINKNGVALYLQAND